MTLTEIETDEEQVFISNLQPWLVLSHLAHIPLADSKGRRDLHLDILAKLGSYPDLLRRIDIGSLKYIEGFHFHEVKGREGKIVCDKSGIVEPIVCAMQAAFGEMPDEMLRLCQFAQEKDEFFLAWRLFTAARASITLTKESASNAAKRAICILNPVLDLKRNICKKVGRNDICPCGSGRKYKKCCIN